jgi:UDP-N-acetylmuramoylalanine--D-glutamate ligase
LNDKLVKEIADKSPAKKMPIRGKYYDLDKAAARKVGEIFKIPTKKTEKVLNQFKGLFHRLELVGEFEGITFYNDSLATVPEATISAIESLGEKVETIILGGFDRKIDFDNLADKILRSEIKTVILFPSTGEKIKNTIMRQNNSRKRKKKLSYFLINPDDKVDYNSARYMREAVKIARQNTSQGKICLLSTACPSFSIFKNYQEKGNLFKKYVRQNNYGQKKK